MDKIQKNDEALKVIEKQKINESREMTELIEAKTIQIKDQNKRMHDRKLTEFKTRQSIQEGRYRNYVKNTKNKRELKKKFSELITKMQQENMKRQKNKELYKKQLALDKIKFQDDKLTKSQKLQNNIEIKK